MIVLNKINFLLLKYILKFFFFFVKVGSFLKLIIDMYNKSSTQDKILNFQKTNDIKTLISQIRVTTTITRNSVNVSILDKYVLL